jgi:hypothetical protein
MQHTEKLYTSRFATSVTCRLEEPWRALLNFSEFCGENQALLLWLLLLPQALLSLSPP